MEGHVHFEGFFMVVGFVTNGTLERLDIRLLMMDSNMFVQVYIASVGLVTFFTLVAIVLVLTFYVLAQTCLVPAGEVTLVTLVTQRSLVKHLDVVS